MASWTMQRDGEVAILTLDDGKANTFAGPEFSGLEAVLDEAAASDARACVLTGRAGFLSAGLNLKVMAAASLEEKRALVTGMGNSMLKLFLFPKPVVTAVSGHALGAGAMLALAADVRIFADGPFKFGLNEVPAGLFVPTFALELALNVVPPTLMTEFCGHGRTLSPAESLAHHITEAVVPPERLLETALARARALGALSGSGYTLTKRLMREHSAELGRSRLPGELDELARMLDTIRPRA